jgi:hypothetical protein
MRRFRHRPLAYFITKAIGEFKHYQRLFDEGLTSGNRLVIADRFMMMDNHALQRRRRVIAEKKAQLEEQQNETDQSNP